MPDGSPIRFEAKVHPGDHAPDLGRVADLDLDRIPDPEGGVRLLVTPDDAARLVEAGFEVHLVRAHRVAPLDPKLVLRDEDARSLLEDATRGLERREGD